MSDLPDTVPTMGRIVYFTDERRTVRPAVVMAAYGYSVDLYVFEPGRAYDVCDVPYCADKLKKGTWRWPQRSVSTQDALVGARQEHLIRRLAKALIGTLAFIEADDQYPVDCVCDPGDPCMLCAAKTALREAGYEPIDMDEVIGTTKPKKKKKRKLRRVK